MITAILIPRAFAGDVARRQLNALRALRAQEFAVILFGDDEGIAQVAAAEGARHMPGISTTEYGTPLVSEVFRQAAELADTPLLLYANADVVVLPGLERVAARVKRERFLGVGRRIDLALNEEIAFEPGWEERLASAAGRRGRLHAPFGIDWFLFPKTFGLELELPPFAVGRPGWDNWLIAHARRRRVPVVDLSGDVTVIHQEHGYEHVPEGAGRRKTGPEADANLALAAGADMLGILDATHVLGPFGLMPAVAPRYLRRRLSRLRRGSR